MRLQPSQRQVAAGEGRRQAHHPRLWHGHAGVCSIRRREPGGLRSARDRVVLAGEVACLPVGLLAWREKVIKHKTAIFRQINKERVAAHHDALEFPDGQIVPLTFLCEGQQATVLQLPAEPRTAVETDPSSELPTRADPGNMVKRGHSPAGWSLRQIGFRAPSSPWRNLAAM